MMIIGDYPKLLPIELLPLQGQSNAIGYNATPVVTGSAMASYTAIMPNGQKASHSWEGDTFVPGDVTDFQPAYESVLYGDRGEMVLSSMMRYLHVKLNEPTGARRVWCGYSSGRGDKKLSELNYGTLAFSNMTAQASRLRYLAASQYGRESVVRFCPWVQGESDLATDPATYKAQWLQVRTDTHSTLSSITGQSEQVHLGLYQTAAQENVANAYEVPIAQAQAARDSAYIHIATPGYFFSYADNLHLTAASQALLGEYFGRCYIRAVINGSQNTSLKCVSASLNGAIWTLDFEGPGTGLSWNTGDIETAANYGFVAKDGGAADTISSVVITGNKQVQVTLDGVPSGTATLSYAKEGGTTGLNHAASWGNLVDISPEFSIYRPGYRMSDWCEIFKVTN